MFACIEIGLCRHSHVPPPETPTTIEATNCQLCATSITGEPCYVTHESPWIHFVGPFCRRCCTTLENSDGWERSYLGKYGEGSR